MRKVPLSIVGASAVLVLWAAGCATTQPPSMGSTAQPKPRYVNNNAAHRQVEEARRMIEAGDYSVVIPNLLLVVSQYPNTTAALDARYWMGVAYWRIQSYRDAITLFNEYLSLAPDGKYAEKSSEYSTMLVEEYERKFWTARKLAEQIEELQKQLKADPDNLKSQWQLADLYWKRGDYDEAGRLYAKLIEKNPSYAQDSTVRGRIELQPSGQYVVLSPSEVIRRAIEERPLVVHNVNAFEGGDRRYLVSSFRTSPFNFNSGSSEEEYYVVTGQVTNRADSTLYGVQVLVTIYGFGNVVFDTRTVTIGRLNSGDTRAFSVRFTTFDGIQNINRYECIGTFQR